MAAVLSPAYVTLTADTDAEVELSGNFGAVEVTLVANAATTYFNAKGTAVPSIASPPNGQHVLTPTLLSKVVKDDTSGNTVVHLRSSGTPTVSVAGL